MAFVAKSEVASWPLVGVTAKLQRTVFVDRARRQQTGDAIAEIVRRLAGGTSVVLFAEGTSSDGNRVLPFRSALVGAVQEAGTRRARHPDPADVDLLHGLHGMPMGRQHRPLVAWYGDLDFLPHIKAFIARGAIDAVVSYGEPCRPTPASRPQGHGEIAGRRGARRSPPRPCADGRARLTPPRLKSVMKSTTWVCGTKARHTG